jgi:hypothetical protein
MLYATVVLQALSIIFIFERRNKMEGPDKVLRDLRAIAAQQAGKQVFTFEVRVADMACDAANAIADLQAFTKQIEALNSCNDCDAQRTCGHCPRIGEPVRYNCFMHKPREETLK